MAIATVRPTAMALAIGLVVLDAFLFVPTTRAHGGTTVARVATGAYQVEATVSGSGDRIDETIVVLERESLDPAPVQVAVTLVGPDGEQRGPFVGRSLGTNFEVLYPPPPDDSGWRVRIDVVGPTGPATVEHPFRAPGREWAIGSGLGGVALGVLGFVVPAAIVLVLLLRPRREAGDVAHHPPTRMTNGG